MVKDKVTLTIENNSTYISGDLNKNLYQELRKKLGYRPENADFMIANSKFGNKWDGYITTLHRDKRWCKCPIKKAGVHFPTGLASKAKGFLECRGVEVGVKDIRVKPKRQLSLSMSDEFESRAYQGKVINDSVKQTRGIIKIATGGGKCLGKGTPILMFDGSIKAVEDVVTGDLLMGPDSSPRTVLSTTSGVDNLYKIIPTRGESFVVNEPHILSLKMTGGHKNAGEVVNISVADYFKQNKTFKHCAKGYRSAVDFDYKDISIDPYFLGIWLGDGRKRSPEITTADDEIVSYLEKFAKSHSLKLVPRLYKDKCPQYAISTGKIGGSQKNVVLERLRDLSVINNKHVPMLYKCNSKEVRLKVLAGLLDSDGSLHNNGYDFISKIEQLSNDVAFISRSLGLRALVSKCKKTCTNNGVVGTYYRVSISGDCSIIPVKIQRKKASVRKQKKNCLHFGFNIESIGRGEYYGFELSGDRLFMLGDFTVTHNTGVACGIISKLGVKPFIFYVTSIDLLLQAKEELQRFVHKNGKPIDVGMIGGGHYEVHDINVITVQTAIRALGLKYKKGDEDDKSIKDSKKVKDHYDDIKKLVMSAKGMIADEVQHWAAETCQVLSDYSINAYYKYGFSATPWRDMGDDILIDSCFGKKIADISASKLIKMGYLVKPNIFFVSIKNMRGTKRPTYNDIYDAGIVNNG